MNDFYEYYEDVKNVFLNEERLNMNLKWRGKEIEIDIIIIKKEEIIYIDQVI